MTAGDMAEEESTGVGGSGQRVACDRGSHIGGIQLVDADPFQLVQLLKQDKSDSTPSAKEGVVLWTNAFVK